MDRASEDYITAREICLAMSCNARVHICHVSTKGSVNIIRAAKKDGVKVTCETAPHYFTFTDEKLLARDADFRMSPPLRTEEDRLLRKLFLTALSTASSPTMLHTPQRKRLTLKKLQMVLWDLKLPLQLRLQSFITAANAVLTR